MNRTVAARKLPVGAEVQAGGGVAFRVWAPVHKSVEVVTAEESKGLQPDSNGYFSGTLERARAGTRYRFRLDGRDEFPDPASRFQPEGPHGPSEVIDPSLFEWTDAAWKGVSLQEAVIYELHIGTFTREGTWQSATAQLAELARTGITVVEIMPLADFSGEYGWGYDGVNWFAPTRLYGHPDEFRAFVDRAHSLGIAVILDVVYNHFGADGNYTGQFSPYYLSKTHHTDWGDAINYDGEQSGPVREFVRSNAAYWIDEYHLDGVRLDATQDIFDDSPTHILGEIQRSVREAAPGRKTLVIAENEPQDVKLVRPAERGGYGMDGLWNDDFHHSARVALTGRNEAYYTDYCGSAQELLSAMKYGFLYQGQWYQWQQKRRGTPSFGVHSSAFISYIQNHDQVANSGRGLRVQLLTSPGLYRTLTTMLLLGPGTPLLFMGQEFGASIPFLYFADVPEHLRQIVRQGRRGFLSQWLTLRTPEMQAAIADPCSRETFERCKLDRSRKNVELYALHCDLLRMRREDPVISGQRRDGFDGAVLPKHAFVFRMFSEEHGDRLLVVNLGADLYLSRAPEPLLAPPLGEDWDVLFSTEDPRYGGDGTPPLDTDDNWRLLAQSVLLLKPVVRRQSKVAKSRAKSPPQAESLPHLPIGSDQEN